MELDSTSQHLLSLSSLPDYNVERFSSGEQCAEREKVDVLLRCFFWELTGLSGVAIQSFSTHPLKSICGHQKSHSRLKDHNYSGVYLRE